MKKYKKLYIFISIEGGVEGLHHVVADATLGGGVEGGGVHYADATLTDCPPYLLIYIIIDFISIYCIFGQKIEVNI